MAWESTTVVRARAKRQMQRVKGNALEMFSPAMGAESVQEIIDQMPVNGEVLAYQQELTAKLNEVSGFRAGRFNKFKCRLYSFSTTV